MSLHAGTCLWRVADFMMLVCACNVVGWWSRDAGRKKTEIIIPATIQEKEAESSGQAYACVCVCSNTVPYVNARALPLYTSKQANDVLEMRLLELPLLDEVLKHAVVELHDGPLQVHVLFRLFLKRARGKKKFSNALD